MRQLTRRFGLIGFLMAGLCLFLPATSPSAKEAEPRIFSLESRPFDQSYGEWHAQWWQKVVATPPDRNPFISSSETFPADQCALEQSGKVWFILASQSGTFTLPCPIPAGTAIAVPVFTTVAWFTPEIDEPLGFFLEDVIPLATSQAASFTDLFLTLDGKEVENVGRFRSFHGLFPLTFPEGNLAGYPAGDWPAAVDGVVVLLKPLPVGTHTVHMGGTFTGSDFVPGFSLDTTLHFEVVPPGKIK